MDEKEKKLLDFLLADFNSLKGEIARRSNLQKAAVAALLALYAWVFDAAASAENSVEILFFTWGAAILAAMYVYREQAEISRLGWIIKNNIAKRAGEIIGVEKNAIIPSEAHTSEPKDGSINKNISVLFAVVIYFIIPLFFTFWRFCGASGT